MRGRRWRGTEGVSSCSYSFFLQTRAPGIHHPCPPHLPGAAASRPGGIPPTDRSPRIRVLSGHRGPRGLARAAASPCPWSRLGARGRPREQPGRRRLTPGERRAPAPPAARAASAPRCAPVPLGPERSHSGTPAQPGRGEGARRPRGRPSLGAAARALGLGPAAHAQPGAYRGVSRAAAAAALQPLLVRSGLGASPAAGAQSRGSRPAARSAVAAGERRARVRAGPAAATGTPRRRRCRRLW